MPYGRSSMFGRAFRVFAASRARWLLNAALLPSKRVRVVDSADGETIHLELERARLLVAPLSTIGQAPKDVSTSHPDEALLPGAVNLSYREYRALRRAEHWLGGTLTVSDKRIEFVGEDLTVLTGLGSVERVLEIEGYVAASTTDHCLLIFRVDSSVGCSLRGQFSESWQSIEVATATRRCFGRFGQEPVCRLHT